MALETLYDGQFTVRLSQLLKKKNVRLKFVSVNHRAVYLTDLGSSYIRLINSPMKRFAHNFLQSLKKFSRAFDFHSEKKVIEPHHTID